MRLVAPDKAVAGMEVRGAQTGHVTRYDGRIMDVQDPMHVKALRSEGAFPASLSGHAGRPVGYRCAACGWGSYFITCSRCGGECSREA